MWTENPEMVVFLALGLADCVAISMADCAIALMADCVAASVTGCVSGVELILLTQSHLQVVDVFA